MTEQPIGPGPDGSASPTTGPLAEEALRLLASVQDWTRRSFASADSAPADEKSVSSAGHSAHTAAGGTCQWCPLCQFVAVLRGDRPEVTARVAEAGTAVVAARRALVDAASTAAPPEGAEEPAAGQHRSPAAPAQAPAPPTGPAAPRVQRIDLGDFA